MKLTLMTKDRKKFINFPIVPDDLTWGRGMSHQTVETITNGEILIPGMKKLIDLQIDSFFPQNKGNVKKYSYSATSTSGEELALQIESWRDKSEIIRLVLSPNEGNSYLNILVLIESFERKLERNSDISYSLKLKQYIE